MRITQSLMTQLTRQGTDRASRALLEATRQINAGTAIERPSDNPIRASRLQLLDRFGADLDRLAHNRRIVETDLTAAEAVLGDMHEAMVRAGELAVAMSSDTMNADDRANAANEVQRILDQLVGLANRRQAGDKFLFTGLAEDQPPLAPGGGFQGNNGARFVEIGPGVTIEATIRGSDTFGPNNEVVTALQGLVQALQTNDLPGLQGAIDDVEGGRRILSMARSEVGSRLAAIGDVHILSQDLQTNILIEREELIGVDLARIAPAISSAQVALEAVVSVSQNVLAQLGRAWLR